ncbi:Fic/DOC family protein [Bifidobacterium choloepi]|uniref:Fic/DOC family protein n=1 Tax=Bifidobacterium choloepi TaxID=2614131 RepID=UPI0038B29390
MAPSDGMMALAASHEAGHAGVDALVDFARNERAEADATGDVAGSSAAGREHAGGEGAASGKAGIDARTVRADRVFANTVALAEHGWKGSGDLDELVAIHAALYDGVFADAGRLRTEDAPRVGSSAHAAGTPMSFFPAQLIETGAANLSSQLAEQRNLKALDRPDFVRALATIYDELGYLHPFLGGNASVLRMFASRLSHFAGWDLDWGLVSRDEYRAAKQRAYAGDTAGFEAMFDRIVRPANPSRVFLVAGWDQGPAH